MNKIYMAGELEIVDLSGSKSIEDIKREFNTETLIDVTIEKQAQEEANKVALSEKSAREEKIQNKIREIAERELTAEGKL